MPVPPSKIRRGRPPGSTNKAKGSGSRAGRKMPRGSKPRGSISMLDQERLIQAHITLQHSLASFAMQQGFQHPVLWAQAAASTLTGHMTKAVLAPKVLGEDMPSRFSAVSGV